MGFGNGKWDFGTGFGSEENLASKDRAESPTAKPERPKKDKRLMARELGVGN